MSRITVSSILCSLATVLSVFLVAGAASGTGSAASKQGGIDGASWPSSWPGRASRISAVDRGHGGRPLP